VWSRSVHLLILRLLQRSFKAICPFACRIEEHGDDSSMIDIEGMYAKVRAAMEEGDGTNASSKTTDLSREAFWREMDQTDDSFETISRYFAKGVIL
jgi:hypothetical protein